jgi:hypothetical protein
MANACTHQIHVTNCTTKLHSPGHEARKIVYNNLSSATQEHVTKLSFYTSQALPLVKTMFLRLANSSPLAARSPARRSRDDREMSGKTSAGFSCAMSAQLPGNSLTVATATPPDARQGDSQDSLQCATHGRAMSAPETCGITHNTLAQLPRHNRATVGATPRKTAHSNLNQDIQKL